MLGRHVYRVTPADAGVWRVVKDGETGVRGERPSREDALSLACDLAAQDEPARVLVETSDGKLDEEHVFGIDRGQTVRGA
jgi:hypothetical protein